MFGTIKVASKDGSLNGYVSSPDEEGLYGYTTDASSAAKFEYSSCASSPFAIVGESTVSEVCASVHSQRVTDTYNDGLQGTTYDLFGAVQDARTGCFLVGNVPESSYFLPR